VVLAKELNPVLNAWGITGDYWGLLGITGDYWRDPLRGVLAKELNPVLNAAH
jgi:hypothetical protein